MKFTPLFLFIYLFFLINTSFSQSFSERKIDIYTKSAKDSLIGKYFIDFESSTMNHEKFKLCNFRGKVILLNFWFIGCMPCMGEIPDINKIFRTFKDSNVIIISLSKDNENDLIDFIRGRIIKLIEPIEYSIIPDCKAISEIYNVQGYPKTIIIDKNGVIRVTKTSGDLSSLKKFSAFYSEEV